MSRVWKVGDICRGTDYYTITNPNSILKITHVIDENFVSVQLLAHKEREFKYKVGAHFTLRTAYLLPCMQRKNNFVTIDL